MINGNSFLAPIARLIVKDNGHIIFQRLFLLFFLPGLVFPLFVSAQDSLRNPYHLPMVSDLETYHRMCTADSNQCLVDLEEYIPGIILDIRYATDENFTGEVIYPSARAFVRLPVAKALKRVQADLNRRNLGLKIYDAYRPYAATLKFWDVIGDTLFVAAPWKGSRHNRGCAVDVTLIDLNSGDELEMPTPFDDFSPQAASDYQNLPAAALENRDSMIEVMSKFGFIVMDSEWWHFDFKEWERFGLLDIPFEALP